MSMPMQMEWVLVTEGKQEHFTQQPNCYKLLLDGYRLLPIDHIIEVKREHGKARIGFGKIIEMKWRDGQTSFLYRLTSLESVN